MEATGVYGSLLDVLTDPKFPEVDCLLRQGRHVGQEDLTTYTFLVEAQSLLNSFYRNYNCKIIRSSDEVGDFFFLHSYGDLLGKRKLSVQAMKVGMALGFMISDPEYIDRRIPVDRLISTLKMLLGEDRFQDDFAPRARGRNTDRDEERAQKAVETAIRQLADLGFVYFPKKNPVINVLSPIYRFLEPIRGIGRIEDAIQRLIKEGVVEDLDDEDIENFNYDEEEGQ